MPNLSYDFSDLLEKDASKYKMVLYWTFLSSDMDWSFTCTCFFFFSLKFIAKYLKLMYTGIIWVVLKDHFECISGEMSKI